MYISNVPFKKCRSFQEVFYFPSSLSGKIRTRELGGTICGDSSRRDGGVLRSSRVLGLVLRGPILEGRRHSSSQGSEKEEEEVCKLRPRSWGQGTHPMNKHLS